MLFIQFSPMYCPLTAGKIMTYKNNSSFLAFSEAREKQALNHFQAKEIWQLQLLQFAWERMFQ